MAFEFRLQDPGEGIHEAEILEVSVSPGDHVEEGDEVLVAETDKAAVEIPSPVTGKIVEINVGEGDVVRVGEVLMVIEEAGKAAAESESGEEAETAEEPGSEGAQRRARDGGAKAEPEEARGRAGDGEAETEEARNQAGDGEAEAEEAQGRAGDGEAEAEETRDQAGDGEAEAEETRDQAGDGEAEAEETKDRPAREARPRGADVLATPAVRGLARELGINLAEVEGSGENGRILEKDVQAVRPARERRDGDGEAAPAAESYRVPLRSVRRTTARRMAEAWRDIPHAVHHDRIDITALERLRRGQADEVEAEAGAKLTLTPFLVKALAGSLRQHASFNAVFHSDQSEVEIRRDIHVGVALDTERGLLVPVLRDADRKSVIDIAMELNQVARKLRDSRASGGVLKGGTFTLTNVGAIGGSSLSPIINPPQVAIFGAARAALCQMTRGDLDNASTATALVLPVCLAFDHRVNDGADAARFVNTVKGLLEDPAAFALRS